MFTYRVSKAEATDSEIIHSIGSLWREYNLLSLSLPLFSVRFTLLRRFACFLDRHIIPGLVLGGRKIRPSGPKYNASTINYWPFFSSFTLWPKIKTIFWVKSCCSQFPCNCTSDHAPPPPPNSSVTTTFAQFFRVALKQRFHCNITLLIANLLVHLLYGLNAEVIEEVPLSARDPFLALVVGLADLDAAHQVAPYIRLLDDVDQSIHFVQFPLLRLIIRQWLLVAKRGGNSQSFQMK